MVWIRAKKGLIIFLSMFMATFANAQESLWKTFNPFPTRGVPAYSGGLSPFPQKRENIDELEFEDAITPLSSIETIEADTGLTDEEKKLMLTTSILAELKAFLEESSVYIPNLDHVVIEAIGRSNGIYKVLIDGIWYQIGDAIQVPVDEAVEALNLLDRLRNIDNQIAETVENAVIERTHGRGQEIVTISDVYEDRVVFEGVDGKAYVVEFLQEPY